MLVILGGEFQTRISLARIRNANGELFGVAFN